MGNWFEMSVLAYLSCFWMGFELYFDVQSILRHGACGAWVISIITWVRSQPCLSTGVRLKNLPKLSFTLQKLPFFLDVLFPFYICYLCECACLGDGVPCLSPHYHQPSGYGPALATKFNHSNQESEFMVKYFFLNQNPLLLCLHLQILDVFSPPQGFDEGPFICGKILFEVV